MKMTVEHYETLKSAIASIPIDAIADQKERLQKDGRVKNVDKRLRWDCLCASQIKIGDGVGMPGLPLYQYLNDTHIDTALRNIMNELFNL
jgi:hypothetical protein